MKQVYSNSGELCTPLKERRGCKIRKKKLKIDLNLSKFSIEI